MKPICLLGLERITYISYAYAIISLQHFLSKNYIKINLAMAVHLLVCV